MLYRLVLVMLSLLILQPLHTVRGEAGAQAVLACDTYLSPWLKVAPMPSAHLEGATAVVNGKLYIIAGFKNNKLQATGRVDVYNPATNSWESVANPRRPLPTPLSHSMAAVADDSIWMAGGFTGNHPGPATDEVWKYDTVQDLWFAGPPLPAKRAGGALAKVGQYLHYLGGTSFDRDTAYADHWILNLEDVNAGWQNAPALPAARIHLAATNVQGNLYAVGGQIRHDHDPIDLKSLYQFNPAANTWSTKADLPVGRSHFEPGTLTYDASIIIVGGRANQNGPGFGQLKMVTMYNAATNKWCELRQLPLDLIAPHAARVGNQLIVTGGGSSWNVTHQDTYVSTFMNVVCQNDFDELVVNGCFEETETEGVDAPPWAVKNGATAKVVCNGQKLVALEGHCAFQFKGAGGVTNKLTQQVNLANFEIGAGDTLTLHGYVNAKKATTSGKVTVQIKYADSTKGKITSNLVETHGYQPLTGQLSVVVANSSIEKIVIAIKNQSPEGKVFVDAISLRLTKSNAVNALIPLP